MEWLIHSGKHIGVTWQLKGAHCVPCVHNPSSSLAPPLETCCIIGYTCFSHGLCLSWTSVCYLFMCIEILSTQKKALKKDLCVSWDNCIVTCMLNYTTTKHKLLLTHIACAFAYKPWSVRWCAYIWANCVSCIFVSCPQTAAQLPEESSRPLNPRQAGKRIIIILLSVSVGLQ